MPPIRDGENNRRRVRTGDENNSVRDWQRLGKDLLRQRCREYGLLATGKLGALAVRLFDHFNPPDPAPELAAGLLNVGVPADNANAEIQDQEGQVQPPNQEPVIIQPEVDLPAHNGGAAFEVINANNEAAIDVNVALHEDVLQAPNHAANDALLVSREDLRKIIREEVAAAAQRRQQPAAHAEPVLQPLPLPQTTQQPQLALLSPASINAIPSSSRQIPEEGNVTQLIDLQSSSFDGLPPLSTKISKLIQNREYVNFSMLLPGSLYSSQPDQLKFEIQASQSCEDTISMSTTRNNQHKITSFSAWLEAWNIFIRGTVYFHPKMAQELLAYQEAISNYARIYPFEAWSQYDHAFRLKMAMNKSFSWAQPNDYLRDKFLRLPNKHNTHPVCFLCAAPGHYASNCPKNQGQSPNSLATTSNVHASSHPRSSSSFRASSSFRSPSSTPSLPTIKTQLCSYFNNANQCSRQFCLYTHRCNKCGGPHPGSACKNY